MDNTIVGNHGHSSSLKKQEIIAESSSFGSDSSGFSSSEGSTGSASIELQKAVKTFALQPGQAHDTEPEPQSSDIPRKSIRAFLTNVIKDKKLKTITIVVDIKGQEFNLLVNNKTVVEVGSNPGTIDDLLPNETIVFTSAKSIVSHVNIIAGVAQGIVSHIDASFANNTPDSVGNTDPSLNRLLLDETGKKKRQNLN